MALREFARALHLALRHPHRYFEEYPPANGIGHALGVVFVVASLSALAMVVLGWMLSHQIDATTTVVTMEPWPDSRCAMYNESANATNVSAIPEQCTIDEPRTTEVDLGDKAYSVFADKAPLAFFAVLAGWPLTAIGLHVLSAFHPSEGSFGDTLTVTGIGMAPMAFQTGAVTAGIAWRVQGTTFGSNPATVADHLRALAETPTEPLIVVAILLVAAWQAWIWAAGLERARNLTPGAAKLTAAIVALVGALMSIL